MDNLRLECETGSTVDYAEFGHGVYQGRDVISLEVRENEVSSMVILSDEQLIKLRDTLLDAFPLERHPYE